MPCSEPQCQNEGTLYLPSAPTATYCQACMEKRLPTLPQGAVVSACPGALQQLPSGGDQAMTDVGMVTKTYAEFQKDQRAKTLPVGSQIEHALPNSSLVSGAGRKADPVIGAANYSEGKALTYIIDDDQSPGTEHKFITDCEREVDKALHKKNQYATVEEKIAMMVPHWQRMLLKFRRSKLPKTNPEAAALRAALALGHKVWNHKVKTLGIKPNTPLRNGMVRGAKAPGIAKRIQQAKVNKSKVKTK